MGMSDTKKYVRRSYFAHQYEKEEIFLSKMAKAGWNFVKLHKGIITKYEFDKCEPVDYIYQLDYINQEEDTPDYHQLFQDAGWEEVYVWDGMYNGKWYYFRRVNSSEKAPRIFTDPESKLQMYDKLLKSYGLFMAAILFLQFNSFKIISKQLGEAIIPSLNYFGLIAIGSLTILFIILYAFLLLGLLIKRNQIAKTIERQL